MIKKAHIILLGLIAGPILFSVFSQGNSNKLPLIIPVVDTAISVKDMEVAAPAELSEDEKAAKPSSRILYGQASYYAAKFEGRRTANGETFRQNKLTAACNVLPLGTWVKVTNLRNGKTVVVKTNDRLHKKTKRIIDLSTVATKKLGYTKRGLTRVKIEVYKKKP